jgi:hypothetical protein
MIEYEYYGLKKVISGGQCGADKGGLVAAYSYYIETGGHVPKGYKTCQGNDPTLSIYELTEDSSTSYTPRTVKNIQNSDGTIIFSTNLESPGTVLTIKTCKELNKPFHIICDDYQIPNFTAEWIINKKIEVLNVAGNRDKVKGVNTHYMMAGLYLYEVFKNLKDRSLLIQKI